MLHRLLLISRRPFAQAAQKHAPAPLVTERLRSFQASLKETYQGLKAALPRTGYTHPFHSYEKPLAMSHARNQGFYFDFIGPEQVSPHYESFAASRRVLLTTLFGYCSLTFLAKYNDLAWAIRSTLPAFIFYYLFWYALWEGRKFVFLPLQMDWYAQLIELEKDLLLSNAAEDLSLKNKECVEEALEQLEFMDLHNEFQWVKENAIRSFVVVERKKLQEHLKERSLALLKNAQSYEQTNRKNLIHSISSNSLKILEQSEKNPSKEVLDSVFEAGLDAILNDKMTYKNDRLLKDILDGIRSQIKKFNDMTPEQLDNKAGEADFAERGTV